MENQGEQPIITTKPTTFMWGEGSLTFIPFHVLALTIVQLVATPTLVVSSRIELVESPFVTTPLTHFG